MKAGVAVSGVYLRSASFNEKENGIEMKINTAYTVLLPIIITGFFITAVGADIFSDGSAAAFFSGYQADNAGYRTNLAEISERLNNSGGMKISPDLYSGKTGSSGLESVALRLQQNSSDEKTASSGILEDRKKDPEKSGDPSQLSPMNPDFLKYWEDLYSSRYEEGAPSRHSLGLIPSPVDFSHNRGILIRHFDINRVDIPSVTSQETSLTGTAGSVDSAYVSATAGGSSYDLRTLGLVTVPKDQGQCGSCWAFSTTASLESGLLPDETWDFSENNIKNLAGYDLSPCQGGNYIMSTAYLARWDGPVSEAQDPYNQYSSSSPSSLPTLKHVQEALFLPPRSNALDNENIKTALSRYGALYSTVHWEDYYYSARTSSYYYGGSSLPNHAVTIVGWDDNYDRFKFTQVPAGNGAFIVKNSWGPDWGDDGFVYISYYDTVIGTENAVFLAEPTSNYLHIYQYDPLGWITSFGAGTDTAWFSNVFTSQGKEDLAAVSFYTPSVDSSYEVQVYTGVTNSPVSASPVTTKSGSISLPGYHTINLDRTVPLTAGQKFSVVVKLTTPGYNFPIALEYPYPGFTSGATAHAGESYVSSNGASWSDVTKSLPNTNVCLKAFTVSSGSPQVTPTPTPSVTPTPTPTPTPAGDSTAPRVTITAPRSYSSAYTDTPLQISWTATDSAGVTGIVIDYSTDKGSSWNQIVSAGPDSTSYTWTVPDSLASGTLQLRVTARDAAGNSGYAIKTLIVRTKTSSIFSSLTQGSSGTSQIGINGTFSRVSRDYHGTATGLLNLSAASSSGGYSEITDSAGLSAFFSAGDDPGRTPLPADLMVAPLPTPVLHGVPSSPQRFSDTGSAMLEARARG